MRLRDLIPFGNFTKSNIPPWVFFTFFKFVPMVPSRAKHLMYSKWAVRILDHSDAFLVSLLSAMNSFSIFT